MVPTPVKFNFKARTIMVDGLEVKTKKHASLTVPLLFPTAQELIDALSEPDFEVLNDDGSHKEPPEFKMPKKKELILEAVNQEIKNQARGQFDEVIEKNQEDKDFVLTAAVLEHDKLTLDYIANLEPGQRGARGISQEEIDAFKADYKSVIMAATGKEEKRIDTHLGIFDKPQKIRTNKLAINTMLDSLNIYLANSPMVEETADVANRFVKRFTAWSKEEEKIVADAL